MNRLFVIAFLGLILVPGPRARGAVTLYATRFEASEGYDAKFVLAGQNGWLADGSGGNGLVSDFFPDQGQQAFIGFTPAVDNSASLTLFKPINVDPVAAGTPVVAFSVLMSIFDSTNNHYDCFRWTVYNTNVHRLFTLDFDNETHVVSYALENSSNFVATGATFSNETLHELFVVMNFANNTWSAALDDRVIVNAKPISSGTSGRTLGDIDAVWLFRNRANPGDNYMVFDNYAVTAQTDPLSLLSGVLEPVGLLPNRQFALRLNGEANQNYLIEASTNLFNWLPVKTNVTANGTFDFIDPAAPSHPRRFYRARLAP